MYNTKCILPGLLIWISIKLKVNLKEISVDIIDTELCLMFHIPFFLLNSAICLLLSSYYVKKTISLFRYSQHIGLLWINTHRPFWLKSIYFSYNGADFILGDIVSKWDIRRDPHSPDNRLPFNCCALSHLNGSYWLMVSGPDIIMLLAYIILEPRANYLACTFINLSIITWCPYHDTYVLLYLPMLQITILLAKLITVDRNNVIHS